MNLASFYKGKKVFVSGHTGFKGSWLTEILLGFGSELVGYSKDIPTEPSLFEVLNHQGRIRDIRKNILDLDELSESMKDCEIAFHLAAQPLVRRSYDIPIQTFSENVMGTAHFLEAVRRNPQLKSAVVITTDKVYENLNEGNDFKESDPLGGHDPYSASKAAAEIVFSSYVRSFFSSGCRVSSVRAGNVIGGGDWSEDRLICDAFRAWESKKSLLLRNPAAIRPWQHVLEPLFAYLCVGKSLIENQKIHGEAFNFGPRKESEANTKEVIEQLKKSWKDFRYDIQPLNDGKKEAQILRLNCDKASNLLGWSPKLNFSQAIEWTANWYSQWLIHKTNIHEFTCQQIEDYSVIFSSKNSS
ncbi:MAG: CDP-glucose 4,6-dehydratase [Oligoflexia bacterium]|nr:CDP-glucose 4,6-dehydratase [Oligoflexia bacterium]